jgi:hypothetical protein
MDAMRRFWPALAAIAVMLLLPAAHAALPEADDLEIQSFVLTEAGLAKYMRATRSLKGIPIDDCAGGTGISSLAEAAARIDAVPGAKAAVQAAGLTSRQYVVFAFSLIHNAFASYSLQAPGGTLPPGTSMANVEFIRAHLAELEKLAAETADSTCESAEG